MYHNNLRTQKIILLFSQTILYDSILKCGKCVSEMYNIKI